MRTEPIDNGFLLISEASARKLCGKLPRPGYEKSAEYNGKWYWVARTRHNGKMRWSIRECRGAMPAQAR